MKEEQIIGLLIMFGCVFVALFYGWALLNWPILVLQITVYVVLVIVLAVIGWIGWAMFTALGKSKTSKVDDQQKAHSDDSS